MIEVSSRIEGAVFALSEVEDKLKPLGYSIGGNWDYDHGYFDYKMDDEVGYQFLRIPFVVKDGQLDAEGATIKMGTPFLLSHKYQVGLDDIAGTGLFSGSVNQFQEPQDSDATFPEKYIDLGKALVTEIEDVLLD